MKKKLFILGIVAGTALAWTYKMKLETKYSIKELNAIALEANKTLPTMVDSMTRLERVKAHKDTLEKQYSLTTIRLADLDVTAFNKQMSGLLIGQSCANEQSRALYKAGVSEWFTYADMNGDEIATIKIDQSNCSH